MLTKESHTPLIEDNYFEWEERSDKVPFWQHVIAGNLVI